MAQRHFEQLSPTECYEMLTHQRVGRIVYLEDDGPIALPVNFTLAGRNIVFRLERSEKAASISRTTVGFEVDQVDQDVRTGWSVFARGACDEVDIEAVPEMLRTMEQGPPLPWGSGIHNVWMRIVPHQITGRRLGDVEDPNVV